MDFNFIIGVAFALFAFIFFVVFIYFAIKCYFEERNFSRYFVIIQRVGKCILCYSKKTKKIYFVTKNGDMFNMREKYDGDIDEQQKK